MALENFLGFVGSYFSFHYLCSSLYIWHCHIWNVDWIIMFLVVNGSLMSSASWMVSSMRIK